MNDQEHFEMIIMNDQESYKMIRDGWISELVWHKRRHLFVDYVNAKNVNFELATRNLIKQIEGDK